MAPTHEGQRILMATSNTHGCERCKRQLSLDEIVYAIIEVENVIEDTAEIAIFFVPETGNVSVQSIKQEDISKIKNAKGNQNCEWHPFDGIRYTNYSYIRTRTKD